MALSVASEQAFSSTGITISKRRNCLDSDIIKALQCLKDLNSQDLVPVCNNVASEEKFLDNADQQPANQESTVHEVVDNDEDWTLEGVAEDAGDNDDIGNDANVVL